MPAVQEHGLYVERLLGAAHLGRPLPPADHIAPFDIAACETDDGLPVPVKAAKATRSGARIGLGDARRTWSHIATTPFLMLCATYAQVRHRKVFSAVHAFTITPDAAAALLGDVKPDEVADFHAAIRAYGPGEHGDAREDAKRRQTEMKGRLGSSG